MFIPPATPAQASATAMELSQRLVQMIEAYRQQHPGTSDRDIQMALHITTQHSGGTARRTRMMVIILLGTLLAGLLAFWLALQR